MLFFFSLSYLSYDTPFSYKLSSVICHTDDDADNLWYWHVFTECACRQKSRQIASTRFDNWPLLQPESATRIAIMPHNSFQVRSGYWNSAPLTCAQSIGKSIGIRGSYMSFETCESRILMHSVPLPRYGILGAEGFVMS